MKVTNISVFHLIVTELFSYLMKISEILKVLPLEQVHPEVEKTTFYIYLQSTLCGRFTKGHIVCWVKSMP